MKKFLALIALFGVGACEVISGNAPPHFDFTVAPVEFHEQIGEAPRPGISVVSEEIYPCANYEVTYELDQVNNAYVVRITGAELPGGCFTGFGPARAVVPFPESAGPFHLFIEEGGRADRYLVNIIEPSITLYRRRASRGVTHLAYNLWHRYPERSFVVDCNERAAADDVCGELVAHLRSRFDLSSFDPPAEGEWAYGREERGVRHYFRYVSESDFETVGEEARSFLNAHLDRTRNQWIYLENWRRIQIIPNGASLGRGNRIQRLGPLPRVADRSE